MLWGYRAENLGTERRRERERRGKGEERDERRRHRESRGKGERGQKSTNMRRTASIELGGILS